MAGPVAAVLLLSAFVAVMVWKGMHVADWAWRALRRQVSSAADDVDATTVACEGRPPKVNDAESAHAVMIAMNYSWTDFPLEGCVNDIRSSTDKLQAHYHLHSADLLLERDATRAGILRHLTDMVQQAGAGDQLYIQYSGHGADWDIMEGRKQESFAHKWLGWKQEAQHVCIIPADYATAGTIGERELHECLVEGLAGSGASLVCVMDCCYSGSDLELQHNYRYDRHNRRVVKSPVQRALRSVASNKEPAHIIYFGAASDSEEAEDLPADASAQRPAEGAFTLAYFQTLEHYGYRPTYAQLLEGITMRLRAMRVWQHIQLSSSRPLCMDSVFEPIRIRNS